MSDYCNTEYDQNEYTDIDTQKEIQQSTAIDCLYQLYKNTFEPFRKGEMLVFNPNVFSGLTAEKFIDWAINNNPDLAELFSK